MNERIKELSEQAANEYLSEMEPVTDTLSTAKRDEFAQKSKQAGIGIIPHGFSEKFAELIVRECIEIVEYKGRKIGTKHPVGFNLMDAAWDIKEHFGVEE